MPKEVLCPICGATYNLSDEQVGKKVRCKKCEHAFTAGGEQKRRPEDDEDEDDDRDRDRDRDRGRTKTKAKKKRGRDDDEEEAKPKKTKSLEEQAKPKGQKEPGLPVTSFVIGGVILGIIVLCCGGIGLVWLVTPSSKPKNNPPPNNQKKKGEVPDPAARPAVARLPDIEASRRRAGAAAALADLAWERRGVSTDTQARRASEG
jgi:predicted Zn finger-like uncharacterized protein